MRSKKINIFSSAAIVAAIGTAAIVPMVVVSAEENASISDIVVKQDNQLYKISKNQYDRAVAKGQFSSTKTPISHIVIGESIFTKKQYDSNVARYGSKKALNVLVNSVTPVTIETIPGTIVNGEIIGDNVSTEFKVTDISAVTKESIKVNGVVSPPSSTPTAQQFNVTVGGKKVDVAKVTEQNDGSFLLEVDLTGKIGVLIVNEVAYDDHIVDYLTKLSVYVGENQVFTINNGLSTSLSEVQSQLIGIVEPAILFFSKQGITVDISFDEVKAAIKKEITALTGETNMSNVRLADLDGKTISITISGFDKDNPELVKPYDFEVSFESHVN